MVNSTPTYSGNTFPWNIPYRVPATPERNAEMTNAASCTRFRPCPIAAARTGFSPTARMVRPSGAWTIRHRPRMQTVTTASTTIPNHAGESPIMAGTCPEIPESPPVKSNHWKTTAKVISAHARVSIAA